MTKPAGWLSDRRWKSARTSVPIACVDLVPVRKRAGAVDRVGLIYRHAPDEGLRWCLIGGRLRLNESFEAAAARQVKETLGSTVLCVLERPAQPVFVAEYFSQKRRNALFDPRQHAIGLTFVARMRGALKAQGEAQAFEWFAPDKLPDPGQFGFGQHRVVQACLKRLRNPPP